MGTLGVVVRYSLYYPGILIGLLLIYLVISYFTGFTIPIYSAHWASMFATIFIVSSAFGKRNCRYYSKWERLRVFLGIWIVDLFYITLITKIPEFTKGTEIDSKAVAATVVLLGIIDILMILLFIAFPKRGLIKQGAINC